MGLPIASAVEYPNRASAQGFHSTIVPSREAVVRASSLASMSAER
jgi:hypothetical protein